MLQMPPATAAGFGDAGQFLHRTIFEKIFFLTGGHFEKADALGGVSRELGELGGIGQTCRDRQTHFLFDALPDALDIIRRRRVAPHMGIHRREIQKPFINGVGDQRRRVFLQN